VIPAYENHLKWLEPLDSLKRATTGFRSLISYIKTSNSSDAFLQFLEEVKKLDMIRNENFWQVFPELNAIT